MFRRYRPLSSETISLLPQVLPLFCLMAAKGKCHMGSYQCNEPPVKGLRDSPKKTLQTSFRTSLEAKNTIKAIATDMGLSVSELCRIIVNISIMTYEGQRTGGQVVSEMGSGSTQEILIEEVLIEEVFLDERPPPGVATLEGETQIPLRIDPELMEKLRKEASQSKQDCVRVFRNGVKLLLLGIRIGREGGRLTIIDKVGERGLVMDHNGLIFN